MLVGIVSLWRYGASALLITSLVLVGLCVIGFEHRRRCRTRPLGLTLTESGGFIVTDREQSCDAQLIFALCTSNQLLIRARVQIQGRTTRQEWCLDRTDNEAFWRFSCQCVQWIDSLGEAKKRH